jgi:hypothetical protein
MQGERDLEDSEEQHDEQNHDQRELHDGRACVSQRPRTRQPHRCQCRLPRTRRPHRCRLMVRPHCPGLARACWSAGVRLPPTAR